MDVTGSLALFATVVALAVAVVSGFIFVRAGVAKSTIDSLEKQVEVLKSELNIERDKSTREIGELRADLSHERDRNTTAVVAKDEQIASLTAQVGALRDAVTKVAEVERLQDTVDRHHTLVAALLADISAKVGA